MRSSNRVHSIAKAALAAAWLSAVACTGARPADDDGAARQPTSTTAIPAPSGPAASSAVAIPTASARPEVPPYGDLDVDPASFDFSQDPELTSRIAESPHAYFRFIGSPFRRATCKYFARELPRLPRVPLHGDPHVEQYTVCDLGRWMLDYDDASTGPAVIDLSRMGTSLVLASRQQKLAPETEGRAVSELLRGYADGLTGKHPPTEPPPFAKALELKLTKDRKPFLEMIQKNMVPIDAKTEAFVRLELGAYVTAVRAQGPKRPTGFYDVKQLGTQKVGIGSALTKRYLLLLEGATRAIDDDVVMEIKEIADVSGAPCVQGIGDGAATRRAEAQKIAKLDRTLLPPVLLPDGKFWVNEWLANHLECRVKRLQPDDLTALAYESGLMLAAEHQRPLPGESTGKAGSALKLDGELEKRIASAAIDLADGSERSYARFVREIATLPKRP